MSTELVLLGTAGAPLPVAGRAGISSAVIADERVFMVDCGRGAPSGFVHAGLDFTRLEAILLTHLHADHIGDLPGMLLYPWGVRAADEGPLPPVSVYGPSRPLTLPQGDSAFDRETTIHPELPAPGTSDLIANVLAAYAYHLNVMPLDAYMPDPAFLVTAVDIDLSAVDDQSEPTVTVFEDEGVRISAVPVTHGHAVPALAYRFDTVDGSIVISGDTTPNPNLIRLAKDADILVHSVADLRYLEHHGFAGVALERMAGLHTDVNEVGSVAQQAGARELILTHYLPSEPDAISPAEWAARAARGFTGKTTAGSDGLRRSLPAASS